MEATSQDIFSTQSRMRQVRVDGHSCGPHQATFGTDHSKPCASRATNARVPRRRLVRRRDVDVGRLLQRADVHHLRMTGGVAHRKND